MEEARISRMGGKVKLQYMAGGSKRYALWENSGKGVAETIFDEHGVVLKRQLLPKSEIDAYAREFMKDARIPEGVLEEYSEIRIDKGCPTCNANAIERMEISDGKDPLVMPTYTCKSCGGRSYYLSDEYLEYLVSHNTELFSEQERKEMAANKAAFTSELKEYIIRIFASKRIMRIK